MPFKVFTNGSILPDTDLNDYLMEQVIISCTSSTRPSSPNDGMAIWETDTERYMSYNATAGGWVYLGQMISGTNVPSLTSTGTAPSLGTSPAVGGRYTLYGGNWCNYRGLIKWGSSPTVGSGTYIISLPFTSSNTVTAGDTGVGMVRVLDSSANAAYLGMCFISANSATMKVLMGGTPSVGPSEMGAAAPMVPAVNDTYGWNITYEIA